MKKPTLNAVVAARRQQQINNGYFKQFANYKQEEI